MKRELLAAFAAGAAAMALEMIASRWLAPGFGATLETWSWLIGATLLAGACGAALAALAATRLTAASAMLAASAAILASALGNAALIEALLPLPLQLGAALAALVLVGPAGLSLGAVLPLLAERAEARGGRGLGALVAASTAGSLAGTLLAALVAMPELGARATALLAAALLALAALPVLPRHRRWPRALLALAFLAPALLVLTPRQERELRSPYAALDLRAERDALRLFADGIAQGSYAPFATSRASALAHGQWISLLPYLHPRGRTALQIGLGLGEGARALEESGLAVTSVELDPTIAELVRTRGFTRDAIHVGDGRAFWRRTPERYDFAVLDAFQGETMPEHLLSREALGELRARLQPGGIVVVHAIARSEGAATAAIARTLATVFEHQLALRSPRADGLHDLFLFASTCPLIVPPHPELEAETLEAARFAPPPDGVLLEDDRNPLATLRAEEGRQLRSASLQAASYIAP
ncbi:MAG: fused MFS/spermidine synthase [Planctomycetes bacterium]|nr:fused MFS/spermidine synthase [Planctomycetota bacterium]